MLGFSISQLFYGGISDSIGRKKTLYYGFIIGIIGSLICCFSYYPYILIFGRLIQGTGLGAGCAVGRAISRDLFVSKKLAKLGSLFSFGTIIFSNIAPVIGGYLQDYLGWYSIFWFLFIYGLLIIFAIAIFLPETFNLNKIDNNLSLKKNLAAYKELITNRSFYSYVFCSSAAYAGCLAFVVMSSYLLQDIVGISVIQYSWIFLLLLVIYLILTLINTRLVDYFSLTSLIKSGSFFMIFGGGLSFVFSIIGCINVYTIIIPQIIYSIGAVIILCNAMACALTPFPKKAGAAGGLYGCIQILGGFFATLVISWFNINSQRGLSLIYIVIGVICLISILHGLTKTKKEESYCL